MKHSEGLSKVEAQAKLDELLALLIQQGIEYGQYKEHWVHSEYYTGGAESAAMAELSPKIKQTRDEILSLYGLIFRSINPS